MTVCYDIETVLGADQFIDVLRRSGLDQRRPVDDSERISAMLRHADLIVCARDGEAGRLIGVARSVTDFSYCCYLSDLAVDRDFQGRGIGRELVNRTRAAAGGDAVTLLLLSAPAATAYYPRIGLEHLDACFGARGRLR